MKFINPRAILIAAVMMIGLNLRPFMTSIGPVSFSIRSNTGLSLQGISLLTLLPMLLMGTFALLGPSIQNTLGERKVIMTALWLIGLGCALRLIVNQGGYFIATAGLIGLGVAMIQATLPVIIKREFNHHTGPIMGLYSAMLMGGGALGALITPIVTEMTGDWKIALSSFTLPALIAWLFAYHVLQQNHRYSHHQSIVKILLKQPRTWLLICCFGLMNAGYTSIVTWFVPTFQELGWHARSSGNLMAILSLSQAVAALLLPYCSRHQHDRRLWIGFTLVLQLLGFIGLAFYPQQGPYLWAISIGAGLGGCFALLMVVVLEHLPTPVHAGQLSTLMQGGGFLIAAIAPWLVALLHDLTGSYRSGWIGHAILVLLVSIMIIRLNPKYYDKAIHIASRISA